MSKKQELIDELTQLGYEVDEKLDVENLEKALKEVKEKIANTPPPRKPAKFDAKAMNQVKEMSKKEFQALIDAYKVQNPTKYAMKKEALEAKLKTLN